jgi:hypothetical protein
LKETAGQGTLGTLIGAGAFLLAPNVSVFLYVVPVLTGTLGLFLGLWRGFWKVLLIHLHPFIITLTFILVFSFSFHPSVQLHLPSYLPLPLHLCLHPHLHLFPFRLLIYIFITLLLSYLVSHFLLFRSLCEPSSSYSSSSHSSFCLSDASLSLLLFLSVCSIHRSRKGSSSFNCWKFDEKHGEAHQKIHRNRCKRCYSPFRQIQLCTQLSI